MAMDDGDSSLHSIMEVLDSVYGGVTMYSALMSKLNTVQQGNGELAKDYYEHDYESNFKSFTTICSSRETWNIMQRMPSSTGCIQSTRPW